MTEATNAVTPDAKAEIYAALCNYVQTDDAVVLLAALNEYYPAAQLQPHVLDLLNYRNELLAHGPENDVKWANLITFPCIVAIFDAYVTEHREVEFDQSNRLRLVKFDDGSYQIDSAIMFAPFSANQQLKWFIEILAHIDETHFAD